MKTKASTFCNLCISFRIFPAKDLCGLCVHNVAICNWPIFQAQKGYNSKNKMLTKWAVFICFGAGENETMHNIYAP